MSERCINLSYDPYGQAQFPWKTIREKVPYEGRTRRSDGTGKTRTALLEMRKALPGTPTTKSIRVNEKNNFVLSKQFSNNFVLSKMSHESEHCTIQANCPMQNSFISRQLTPKALKERNLTLLANEEARNFLRSQQANRRSRTQLFWINCPITNL